MYAYAKTPEWESKQQATWLTGEEKRLYVLIGCMFYIFFFNERSWGATKTNLNILFYVAEGDLKLLLSHYGAGRHKVMYSLTRPLGMVCWPWFRYM